MTSKHAKRAKVGRVQLDRGQAVTVDVSGDDFELITVERLRQTLGVGGRKLEAYGQALTLRPEQARQLAERLIRAAQIADCGGKT